VSDVTNYFDRISEIVWTQEVFAGNRRRLLINWNPSQLPLGSNSGEEYSYFALNNDFRSVKELSRKGCSFLHDEAFFSDNPEGSLEKIDFCIIGASRCYEQNLLFFHFASQIVCPEGIVCVLCPNSWGSRRLEKEFSCYWENVETVSKFHGRFFWSKMPRNGRRDVQLAWKGKASLKVLEPGGLVTSPGNFSWKSFDKGSDFLIRTLLENESLRGFEGIGADLGAGYGFLTKSLLEHGNFTKVVLMESDRQALLNAKKNISDPRAEFLWCDVSMLEVQGESVSARLEGKFKWVIMNPPFHELCGKVSLALGLSFFKAAFALLGKGGSLYWVANEHLPYMSEIKKSFRKVSVLNRNSQFLVGCAEK